MSTPRGLLDPSVGLLIKDDFFSNNVVTDNNIGELGWELTTLGNASTLAYQTAQQHGVLRMTTASNATGDGAVLALTTDALVIGPKGFEFKARINYPVELASGNFRIGLDDSVTTTRGTVGVTFESDAGVLQCHTDSATEGDENLLVTAHADLTSGTTMVVAEWVDFKIVVTGPANAAGGPSEAVFFVNGAFVARLPVHMDNDEPMELKFIHWQDSGGSDAVALEIDYVWLFIPR